MVEYTEVLAIWARGSTCYAKHAAKAQYVVVGDGLTLAACGDHVSRAIRQVSSEKQLVKVDVWVKP